MALKAAKEKAAKAVNSKSAGGRKLYTTQNNFSSIFMDLTILQMGIHKQYAQICSKSLALRTIIKFI